MANQAYKFRLYPDEVQQTQINRTFGCCRFVWNCMLSDAQDHYTVDQEFRFPTPAHYKTDYPFLKEVDSYGVGNAQLNLRIALTRFLQDRDNPRKSDRKKSGFPNWKSKKDSRKSYTTNFSHDNIRIEAGKLRLPKLGLLKVVFHRRVEGQIKSCTVSQDPTGKYFVSILTEQPDPVNPPIDPNNVVGLDFSFHDLVVTSEGARPKYPGWFRTMARRLRKAQRRLSKRIKGSQQYEDQRLRVAKIHEDIRNRRLDYLRKISKIILDHYDVVVVENIDLSGMARRGRRRKFGRVIADLGFGILRDLLRQGAEARGKLYVVADRWFPSSQLCSCCGYRNHETKDLSIRTWTCPSCGAVHDRDQNAAQNLVGWYREHVLSTGAAPGIHAEGDPVPTLSGNVKGKPNRGIRKSCGAVDSTSPSL